MRFPCGWLEPAAREPPDARGMTLEDAYALLAELELREVEDLDADWFEAELRDCLPLA